MLAVNFDPFERGYVASLAQPGGNITGVVVRPIELARKQIDLLKQTFPDRARVAMQDCQGAWRHNTKRNSFGRRRSDRIRRCPLLAQSRHP
jgi:hypothetical protein